MIKGIFFSCLCVGLVILAYISVRIHTFGPRLLITLLPTTVRNLISSLKPMVSNLITFAANSELPSDDHFYSSLKKEMYPKVFTKTQDR